MAKGARDLDLAKVRGRAEAEFGLWKVESLSL
jgi:hypothetical protein